MKIEIKSVKGSNFIKLQELVKEYSRPKWYSGGHYNPNFQVVDVSIKGDYQLNCEKLEDSYGDITLNINHLSLEEFNKLFSLLYCGNKKRVDEDHSIKYNFGENVQFNLESITALEKELMNSNQDVYLDAKFNLKKNKNSSLKPFSSKISNVELTIPKNMEKEVYPLIVKAVYDFYHSRE